ncbi:MAG: SDR family oxidoreductase [Flavobacteriales bacterium]|jgi:nucleoside-diphosphate-sugar epimerase|nr:SDR family oxidoreductase [Flavobacteriales bacterium]
MNILITGGAGYVGSVLAREALRHGHGVTAIDPLWFDPATPLAHMGTPGYRFVRGDMGDERTMRPLLEHADLVVHAAAVVGDPASKLFPDLTTYTNTEAARRVIGWCRAAGVKRFFFLSTCSNYGVSDGLANEETPLNPLSLYARSKVEIERHLMDDVGDMDWVIGRLSTVYGISPRMRFDLTVNDFAMTAWRDGALEIFLPESFRPYIHVRDLARTVLALSETFPTVRNQVFNVGFEGENHRKIDIARAVVEAMPATRIEILKDGGDLRDYQVDFSKLHRAVHLERQHDVRSTIAEVRDVLEMRLLTDPRAAHHHNTSPVLHAPWDLKPADRTMPSA